jgi:hypothetical protein
MRQRCLWFLCLLMMVSAVPAEVPAQVSMPAATDIHLGTGSQKVPAGTMLRIVFKSQLDSRITTLGEPFSAALKEDFVSEDRIILPRGTAIRGRVAKVRKPFILGRGGSIALDFDHVMLPSGELIPLTLNLAVSSEKVNQKGVIYTDPGLGKKVENSVEKGKDLYSRIKEKGVEVGQNTAGGWGQLVTVPAAVAGGAVAGTAVTGQNVAIAVFGRGDSAIIQPGDEVTIDFGGSFDLPTQ